MDDRHRTTKELPDESGRILVVDDEVHVCNALSLFLTKRGFLVDTAENGLAAKEKLSREDYFLIITDISMPDGDGLDLLHHIKTTMPDSDVVIMTGNSKHDTYTSRALQDGAFWYFEKPFKFSNIIIIIERIMERQRLKKKELQFERMTMEAKAALEGTLVLAQAVDAKDRYTKDHSKRVSELSVMLGRALGYSEERLKLLEYAGLLHDIGKIGIPEQILNKDGKLTDVEFSTMRKHPETGETIVSQSTFLRAMAPLIRSHHENFDGSGYPDGKRGKAIPEESRILRLADYFDAITSIRPYRLPLDIDQAVEVIEKEKGSVFDPDLVDKFVQLVKSDAFAIEHI